MWPLGVKLSPGSTINFFLGSMVTLCTCLCRAFMFSCSNTLKVGGVAKGSSDKKSTVAPLRSFLMTPFQFYHVYFHWCPFPSNALGRGSGLNDHKDPLPKLVCIQTLCQTLTTEQVVNMITQIKNRFGPSLSALFLGVPLCCCFFFFLNVSVNWSVLIRNQLESQSSL